MTRTTPPRRTDIAALFPALRDHTLPATRLHPRRGAPGSADSSVGGPLLWPAAEPWPMCLSADHHVDQLQNPENVHRSRAGLSPFPDDLPTYHPQNRLPVEPIAMVPVAQLYRRDVPGFLGPDDTDLLQVLWCPLDHENLGYVPKVELRRRRAADITDVLTEPPQPRVCHEDYLPEPCVLHPEQIQEFQYQDLLPPDLAAAIEAWDEDGAYFYELSVADGWKLGGFANWHLTEDPAGTRSDPTAVVIGRGYSLWIFYCPVSFDHPHATAMQ